MKTYKPMQTPQVYSRQLNTVNISLENIENEIRGFVGNGDINQIDFKKNKIPPFVQKKLFGYAAKPDFLCSIPLGGAHSLLHDFTIYREKLSCLINNEMQKSVPDFFVMGMLEGMRKYRQLYEAKEKQCILLPELIAYYQTGNNPYSFLPNGKIISLYAEWLKSYSLLDYSCKTLLEIADFYKSNNANQPKGRKSKDGYSWIRDISKKDEILKDLHSKIDHLSNGSTADIVSILRSDTRITKPTYSQAKAEFPNIGAKSGYNLQYSKAQ